MSVELERGPWQCDGCGRPIERVEDGAVVWLVRPGTLNDLPVGRLRAECLGLRRQQRLPAWPGLPVRGSLRLVHRLGAGPGEQPQPCYPPLTEEMREAEIRLVPIPLPLCDGPDGLVGLQELLEWDSLPPIEVSQLISRLYVPGYEAYFRLEDDAACMGLIFPSGPKGYLRQCELQSIYEELVAPGVGPDDFPEEPDP